MRSLLRHPSNVSRSLRILAGAFDFGLGPTGKLATLVQASPEWSWYACGDRLVGDLFGASQFVKTLWTHDSVRLERFINENRIDAALVILDPKLAIATQSLGIPVIYIDSLPFLWTNADVIPHRVSAYCAQFAPYIPRSAWSQLRRIERLHWVESIIPGVPSSLQVKWSAVSVARRALINFGGAHSTSPQRFAYLDVVAPPLLNAISRMGFREAVITGAPDAISHLRNNYFASASPSLHIEGRTFSHEHFPQEVASSEMLFTAPGLTTILETAGLSVPTVLLPPQNLSQYRNTQYFAQLVDEQSIVSWPNAELQFSHLEALLPRGEEFMVEYIWAEIEALLSSNRIGAQISARLCEVISSLRERHQRNRILSLFGTQGVAQVKQIVTDLLDRQTAYYELAPRFSA